jgi:hypothetical protein
VLAALRAIESTIELVWLERGAWCLGTYMPDARRIGEAQRALGFLTGPGLVAAQVQDAAQIREATRMHAARVAMTRLKCQGFLHQQTFDMRRHSEPAVFGLMEQWLCCAVWVRQHEYEAAWRAWEAAQVENEGEEARIANLTDHARLKAAYRMQFKRPVSTVVERAIA